MQLQHFHQYLLDADLASNNGGWQWCASTGRTAPPVHLFYNVIHYAGVDPQPYFRIFNPVLQSVKVIEFVSKGGLGFPFVS